MSWHRDLDEITEHELREEIHRREQARLRGDCDYCGRRIGEPPYCKFSDRHVTGMRLTTGYPAMPKPTMPADEQES